MTRRPIGLSAPPSGLVQRARPWLGTLVWIRAESLVANPLDDDQVLGAIEAAFAVIAEIHHCMSAHDPDSDLARLARATPGAELRLNRHTCAVLRHAAYWWRVSGGAFDPVLAASSLQRRHLRPSFADPSGGPTGHLADIDWLDDCRVRLHRPVRLDLGGIAKGYAVDQAIATMQNHQLKNALVNAGGDLRSLGEWLWPIAVRDPLRPTRTQRHPALRVLQGAAMATSTGGSLSTDFVRSLKPGRQAVSPINSCTVLAADCVTADALTKWVLQSQAHSPKLQRVLRQHRAQAWQS